MLAQNPAEDRDEFNKLFNILIRFCFAFYWFFDNFATLALHDLLPKRFTLLARQKALNFRLYGLSLSLLLYLRNLLRKHHCEIKERSRLPYVKDESENIRTVEKIKEYKE